MNKLTKWKKILIALKVFLPIIIGGIIDTWKEIVEAYDDNNIEQLHLLGDEVNAIQEEFKKC